MAIKMEQHPTQQTPDYKSRNRRMEGRIQKILLGRDYPILFMYGHTDITHRYLIKQEEPPWCVGCQTPYSVKHLLIDCVNLTPKRQYFYTVNNMEELFEHVKVDKILAFLKAVGLYRRI